MSSKDGPETAASEGSDDLRVVLIEDLREIREGLAVLIDGAPGYVCSGAFGSGEEALARFASARPHVALVDIHLPGISGIEAIRRLKERHPDVVFLVLSVFDDDARVFEALCAGASGYLLKKTPPARLLEALREARAGGGPLSPEVAQRVIRAFAENRQSAQRAHDLTPHEIRILKMLADGHDYPSAAADLGVATSTVIYHMRQIFQKLQVRSKSEAVAKALRTGLFS